jgi:hypothetical protein
MSITGTIHPNLLEKMNIALHPVDFNRDSTVYHMGYEQAKRDIKIILNAHLNLP